MTDWKAIQRQKEQEARDANLRFFRAMKKVTDNLEIMENCMRDVKISLLRATLSKRGDKGSGK